MVATNSAGGAVLCRARSRPRSMSGRCRNAPFRRDRGPGPPVRCEDVGEQEDVGHEGVLSQVLGLSANLNIRIGHFPHTRLPYVSAIRQPAPPQHQGVLGWQAA
eukprot:scaffold167593_cov19-Tisochrysis_lutea.AAC.1